jgi:hypothetical protein
MRLTVERMISIQLPGKDGRKADLAGPKEPDILA